VKINIKPLSVNQCWQGKRFKTPLYKKFEKILLKNLPNYNIPDGLLELKLTFGLSSKNADWDNPIKPFQDILQKRYGFNDRYVYKAIVEKIDVKKGQEFIEFEFKKYKK